jgi:hypothetical protein
MYRTSVEVLPATATPVPHLSERTTFRGEQNCSIRSGQAGDSIDEAGVAFFSHGGIMTTVDACVLELVCGGDGAAQPEKPAGPAVGKATYGKACLRGTINGTITGAGTGAGMLPFAAISGPLTPATVATFVGVGAVSGGVIGCADGMWELYKARHPLEP